MTVQQAADTMPEFVPGDSIYGSAAKFVARLRALSVYHGWDDRLMLSDAQQKVRGFARVWNDSSDVLFENFDDFVRSLMNTFPDLTTKADIQEELGSGHASYK